MQILKLILTSILSEPKSWIISVSIATITYYIARFYYRVKQYPSGPFPLPFIGNVLKFLGWKRNSFELFQELSKQYKPIYTFWMGSIPSVIICDLELAKEAFLVKKNEIAGRPKVFAFFEKVLDGSTDIVFADYGPQWESLRRVAHAAVRKYAVNEKLAYLVNDVVNETVNNIKQKEGINNPFQPLDYLYFTMYNILASSAFGTRYAIDDPEFLKLKALNEEQSKTDGYVLLSEFLPILRVFFKKQLEKIQNNFLKFNQIIKNKFETHKKDYQEGIINDFTDAVIFAKEEALKEAKESAPYLNNDKNLGLVIFDLFLAGSDTSQFTLRWIMLFMANHPEMQKRMRKEVEENIGDRIPVQDDKLNCHFINAFITECMRYRGIVPIVVPHKAICDVTIGDYKIPKDTMVSLHSFAIMNDPKVFDEPDTFKPDRFLNSNGKFLSTRPQGFIPFGMGRRVCPGEKLALADLFLIVVNLLQKTNGYEFAFPTGPGSADLAPDPHVNNAYIPKSYKIMLKKV